MSWLGKITGSDKAAGYAKQGIDTANKNLGTATTDINNATGAAQTGLQPYATQGQAGFNAYANSTGANGSDAANQQYQNWLNNNPLMAQLKLSQRNADRQYNGQGGYGSGADFLSRQRAALENWQGYQGQLDKLGQYGQQAQTQIGNYGMQGAGMLSNALGQNTQAVQGGYNELGKAAMGPFQSGVNFLGNVGGAIAKAAPLFML